MKGYIHIISKNDFENDLNLEQLLHQYKSEKVNVFTKKRASIESHYYSNQFSEYPYELDDDYFYTPTGVFTRDSLSIFNSIYRESTDKKLKYLRDLEGQFSISYSDFNNQQVVIITHITRIQNVFIYEDDNKVVVGTDPLVVGLASQNGKVKFAPDSFVSFIMNGYYGDDSTPFYGVTALPADSLILIKDNTINISPIGKGDDEFLSRKFHKNDFDDLTNDFLNSFHTQPDFKNQVHRLALTGGKDSRLIFAALNHQNLDLSLFTNGFNDNADVLIASRIAKLYNLEHKINSPKISEDNTISINIYKKIKKVMLATSGMVYGYEKVSNPGAYRGDRTFDGVGAELIKGGFSSLVNTDESSDKNRLIKLFHRNTNIFIDSESNSFKTFLDEYIQKDLPLNKLQIDYSMKYRTGRLNAAAKSANHFIQQSHSPFLDNKFLRNALKIDYSQVRNEDIHFEILTRLDPRLLNVPFAKDRWRRENKKPQNPNDFNNWLDRAPLYPNNVLGNYNWRKIHKEDNDVVEQFKDIILSEPKHIVFNIVDYNKVKKLMENPGRAYPMRLIWSIASLIVFVNELSGNINKKSDITFNLHLPSSTISNFKNKKEVVNISNEFSSINSSLTMDADNIMIPINTKRHRKLKLYQEKLSVAPSQKNFVDMNSIYFNACIDGTSSSLVTCSLILYKDKEKVMSKRFDQITKDSTTEFSLELNASDEYDSFKIIFNLNAVPMQDKIKLDYAFYEIKY